MADSSMMDASQRTAQQIKIMDMGDGTYAQCVWEYHKGSLYRNITTGSTTVVKSGAGTLQRIICNKPLLGGVVTVYDNTAASGQRIGTISMPALALTQDVWVIDYGCAFVTGLTVVTNSGMDVTVVYN